MTNFYNKFQSVPVWTDWQNPLSAGKELKKLTMLDKENKGLLGVQQKSS